MSRLRSKFQEIKESKKKALIAFISSCDPDFESSQKILNLLPDCGVDIIELGIPFSDPMADGPTIQKSSMRSIQAGFNMEKAFKLVKNFRKKNISTPIIFMGYFNSFFQFGLKNFFLKCTKFGIDGLIIVDLPPEEDNLIMQYINKKKIDLIRLITPTTDSQRLKTILTNATGFLYYVSVLGITGTKRPSLKIVKLAVNLIKKKTKLPVVIGFGISKKSQVSEISKFADGSVVGSSLVKIIEECIDNKNKKEEMYLKIENFLKNLNKGCYNS